MCCERKYPANRALVLLVIILTIFFCVCSKNKYGNEVLGVINQKKISINDFIKTTVEEFGFDAKDSLVTDKSSIARLKSLFREYYTSYAFYREGEKQGFFNRADVRKRIEKKRLAAVQNECGHLLFKKEILPKVMLKDEDYMPYCKRIFIQHILIKKDGARTSRALQRVNAVKHEILSGQDFASAVLKYSEDPLLHARDGGITMEIDYLFPLEPAIKAAVFSGTEGALIGTLETARGYHLLLIKKIKKLRLAVVKENKKFTAAIKREKTRAVIKRYMSNLKKKYAATIQYYPQRIRNIELNSKKVLYRCKDVRSVTVGEFAARIGKKGISLYQRNREKLNQKIEQEFVEPDVRLLEIRARGCDKDEKMVKKLSFRLRQYQGVLYRDFLREVFAKHITVSEHDCREYYKKNINTYSRADNNTQHYLPYNKIKKIIKRDIIADRLSIYSHTLRLRLLKKYHIAFVD